MRQKPIKLLMAMAMLAGPLALAMPDLPSAGDENLPSEAPGTTSIAFADKGLDPADYSIYLYHGDEVKADISRVTGSGADSAFSLLATVPEAGPVAHHASAYFLRKRFIYDPSVSGPIDAIDFLQDDYVSVQTAGSLEHMSGHINSVIEQAGQYFICSIPIKPVLSRYVTGVGVNLHASDYALITNMMTYARDAQVHPDFAGGSMTFGVNIGWHVGPDPYPATRADVRVNRIEYRLHAKSS